MVITINKGLIAILVGVLVSTHAMSQPSKYALINEKPEVSNLSNAIPMPDGDVRPILAMAVQQGQALGVLTGNAAKQIAEKFGADSKVFVRAVKMRDQFEGCPKVIAKFFQPGTPNEYEVAFKVCPK